MPNASVLAKVADHWAFVCGAYISAFLPWALLSAFDIISEKWRTVERTCKLSQRYLLFSIIPLAYVVVYAEAQRQNGNYQEMCAAMVAIVSNIYVTVLRTVMGLMQVIAFHNWCQHVSECEQVIEDWPYDDKDVDLSSCLMVNNTVVDNELFGTDLGVRISLRNMKQSLMKYELNPVAWLTTDYPDLCTVRWSGAYLCALGSKWCFSHSKPVHFFPGTRILASELKYLWFVTFDVGEYDGHADLFSLGEVCDAGLNLNHAPYNTEIVSYAPLETFKSYAVEFDNLRSSYPSQGRNVNENRVHIRVDLVESLSLAKHLGRDKLESLLRCYRKSPFPTKNMEYTAWKFLLQQSDNTEVKMMIENGEDAPIFPGRMAILPLWDKLTNWRVPQASAHRDIEASLTAGHYLYDRPLSMYNTNVCDYAEGAFDCTRTKVQFLFDIIDDYINPVYRSRGVAIDIVRTLLGEWLSAEAREPEWFVSIPPNSFEFELSEYPFETNEWELLYHELGSVSNSIDFRIGFENYVIRRMVWECQVALQKHLALTFRCDPYLPGNAALIMLFLFSFPAIVVTKKTDGSTKTAPANSPESDNNGEEILILEVPPDIAPNPISVLLRINYTTRKASLQLYSELQNAPFDWDEWVDSAMGCMAGIDDHLNVSRSRTISRTGIDLSKSLLQLHLTFEKDGESRKVNIFERWPIFDSDVCHFEVGQWMKAHEIDVDEGSCSFYDSYFDKSVGTWTAWFSQNAELPWYSKATHLVLPGGINHLRRKRNHPDVIVQ